MRGVSVARGGVPREVGSSQAVEGSVVGGGSSRRGRDDGGCCGGLRRVRVGAFGAARPAHSAAGARSTAHASRAGTGRRCAGFTLVEVLVALVIMSVGMLGVGQLLLVGLQTATSALRRTQAIYLLNDMMERIRANPEGRDAYECASYSPAPMERGCAPSGAPAVRCTSSELAEDDLARWQHAASEVLPLVQLDACAANVRYFAAADGSDVARYEIELSWNDQATTEPSKLVGVLLVAEGERA